MALIFVSCALSAQEPNEGPTIWQQCLEKSQGMREHIGESLNNAQQKASLGMNRLWNNANEMAKNVWSRTIDLIVEERASLTADRVLESVLASEEFQRAQRNSHSNNSEGMNRLRNNAIALYAALKLNFKIFNELTAAIAQEHGKNNDTVIDRTINTVRYCPQKHWRRAFCIVYQKVNDKRNQ